MILSAPSAFAAARSSSRDAPSLLAAAGAAAAGFAPSGALPAGSATLAGGLVAGALVGDVAAGAQPTTRTAMTGINPAKADHRRKDFIHHSKHASDFKARVRVPSFLTDSSLNRHTRQMAD